MQDTVLYGTKHDRRAARLLSCSLQELNGQKKNGDVQAIAVQLNIPVEGVKYYLAGYVPILEVGKEIFNALRSRIIAREQQLAENEKNQKAPSEKNESLIPNS